MFRQVALVLIIVALLTAPRVLLAQDRDALNEGTRARLTLLLRDQRVTGRLTVAASDSIALFDDAGRRRAFKATDLRSVEVFAGRHSRITHNAAIGFLVGAAFGALLGLGSGDACGVDAFQTCTSTESALGGALIFGLGGGAIGLIVGIPARDTWHKVRQPWYVAPPTQPQR